MDEIEGRVIGAGLVAFDGGLDPDTGTPVAQGLGKVVGWGSGLR